MSASIDIQHLVKRFGDFTAVDDVSFGVQSGEVLGFLGPNGAGKSTTMRMITGFIAPTGGKVAVCGHDIATDAIAAKRAIGYLPEGAPTYPDMTPAGLMRFVGQIRGFGGAELGRRVDAAGEKANLRSVLNQRIETLSKGYKRRLGLALAILHDPAVLIMDEPTDGLDPNQKHEVRELIQEMAADKVIVLSTHILEEVHAVCSRAIVIARGKIVADGTPSELEARSRYHNAVSLSVGAASASAAGGALAGLANVFEVEALESADGRARFRVFPRDGQSIVDDVGQLAREQQWEVAELHVEQGRLDEVFRDITARGEGGAA